MPNKVNLIGVFYDSNRTKKILKTLLFKLVLMNNFNKVIFVANSEEAYTELENRFSKNSLHKILIIRAANNHAEFGAMNVAVNILRNEGLECNSQNIFFNDTIFFNYKFSWLDCIWFVHFLRKLKGFAAPYISGNVVYLKKPGIVLGCSVHRWVQTALFAMNGAALGVVKYDFSLGLNAVEENKSSEEDEICSFKLLRRYFDADVLSYHVGAWLFAGGWHSSQSFKDFDKDRLIQKIESIAIEKHISAILDLREALFIKSLNLTIKEKLKANLISWSDGDYKL
jgi:hypothetical protein